MNNIKKIVSDFLNFSKKIIKFFEEDNSHLSFYALIFFFVVASRNFLEHFSTGHGFFPFSHLHYSLYYVFIFSFILLIARIITLESTIKTFKVFSVFFSVVLIGPILDIIYFGFGSKTIQYFFPEDLTALASKFIFFMAGDGVTPGLRFHLFLLIFLIFVYFYIKTNQNIIKSLLGSLSIYCALFFSFITPLVVGTLTLKNDSSLISYGPSLVTEKDIVHYFILCSLILIVSIFYLNNKKLFKIVIDDLRISRITHFVLMFFLGLTIGNKLSPQPFNESFTWGLVLIPVSIIFAWIFSVVSNNFSDREIDEISNKKRPLFNSNLDVKNYKKIGIVSLFLSVFVAFSVHYIFALMIFIFIGIYFVYSMPPIRFKKVTIFSKLSIAVNSLIVVLMGYSFFGVNVEFGTVNIFSFPKEYFFFFLVPFTLATNFIDLKDYEGDLKGKIKTLPVVLGLEKSKKVIALFFALPYLFVAYLYTELFLLCLLFIFINSALILKKNYKEPPLMTSYLSSVSLFILYLNLSLISSFVF